MHFANSSRQSRTVISIDREIIMNKADELIHTFVEKDIKFFDKSIGQAVKKICPEPTELTET